jgi:anti-sigma factor (TIGR02949 family)
MTEGGGEDMGECDSCDKCEELLQPYLDRELTETERLEAEGHLAQCEPCTRRYRFESSLRMYVRRCCEEQMTAELREKLLALRAVAP